MDKRETDYSIKLWGADHKYRIEPNVLYHLAPMSDEHRGACYKRRGSLALHPVAFKNFLPRGWSNGRPFTGALHPETYFIALSPIFGDGSESSKITRYSFIALDEEGQQIEIFFYNLFWFNYHLRAW